MPTGVYERSKQHCENISKAKKGILFTDGHKRNISKAKKGMVFTEAHKTHISENHHSIKGEKNMRWKGGVWTDAYVYLLIPTHPFANKRGYVKKSRVVMEKHIGRYLKKDERVHHIDFNKLNDSIDNLILFPTESAHQKYHCVLKNHKHVHPPVISTTLEQ